MTKHILVTKRNSFGPFVGRIRYRGRLKDNLRLEKGARKPPPEKKPTNPRGEPHEGPIKKGAHVLPKEEDLNTGIRFVK